MDWQNLLVTTLVQALVGTGIGFVCYLVLQRNVEKWDRLTQRLNTLEEKRITAIESAAKEESEKNAERRRQIYERLAKVEREAVTVAACHEQHKELLAGLQEYRSAVIDLARIEEKTGATAAFLDEVNQRVLALKEDVARMEGRDEARS